MTDDECSLLPTTDQDSVLRYSAPNQVFSLDLEIEIEETLRTFIRSWRRVPTIFNGNLSDLLRTMLQDNEERKFNGITIPSSTDYYKSLEKFCRGNQIFGFTLHFPYFNTDEIVDRMKSTAIHESKHPDVVFSITVRVFPYACNLFSVWVCIITQIPHCGQLNQPSQNNLL